MLAKQNLVKEDILSLLKSTFRRGWQIQNQYKSISSKQLVFCKQLKKLKNSNGYMKKSSTKNSVATFKDLVKKYSTNDTDK